MTIDEAVFQLTATKVKDYCRARIDEGADRATINRELKDLIPAINEWSRHQREWIERAMDVLSAPSAELN